MPVNVRGAVIPNVVLFLAGAVFTAALAAFLATSTNQLPWFGLSIALAIAGGALRSRWVRERVSALRTGPMRMRDLHGRGWHIRRNIKADANAGENETRRADVQGFDLAFWQLIDAEYPDRRPVYQRVQPRWDQLNVSPLEWRSDALRLLDARLELLANLLLEN